MDSDRFDRMTRALGAGRTRRGALKLLGGAAFGAAGLVGLKYTADAKGEKIDICHYDADTGTFHEINVSVNARDAHLAHGDVLPEDYGSVQHCTGCGDACGAGQDCCEGGCTDLGTVDNCSSCGDSCSDVDACTPASCDDGVCNAASICAPVDACTPAQCFDDGTCNQASACAPVDACTPAQCFDDGSCNQTSACTGFDTCGGGSEADECGCTPSNPICQQTCDEANGCGGTCAGAAATNPAITLDWEQTFDPNYCQPIVHLSGFAGCTDYASGYFSAFTSGGSGERLDGDPNLNPTDPTGASTTPVWTYVKGQYVDIRIGSIRSGYQVSSC